MAISMPYVQAPTTTNYKKVKINTFRAFVRDDNQDKIVAVVKDWETMSVVSNVLAKGSRLRVRITEPSSRYYGRE